MAPSSGPEKRKPRPRGSANLSRSSGQRRRKAKAHRPGALVSPPRVTRKKRISLSRSGLDALVSATGCIHSRIVAGTTGKTVITTRAACALAAAIARIERGLIPSPPVIREISPSPAPKPRPLKKTRPSKKPKRRQNESESDRQRRDDGPSAPSPAPPSPDKNELRSRLQALEATLQTKALENSALKRDNASLSQQVADMGTRLETLETALQGKREMVKSEKSRGGIVCVCIRRHPIKQLLRKR